MRRCGLLRVEGRREGAGGGGGEGEARAPPRVTRPPGLSGRLLIGWFPSGPLARPPRARARPGSPQAAAWGRPPHPLRPAPSAARRRRRCRRRRRSRALRLAPGSGARAAAASAAAAAAARADAAGRTTSSPGPGALAPRAPDRGRRWRRRRRRRGQRRWRRRLCSFGSSWPPGNYKSQGLAAGGGAEARGSAPPRPEVAVEAEAARPRRGLEHGGGTRSGSGGGSSGGGGGGWRRRRRRTGVSPWQSSTTRWSALCDEGDQI